MNFIIHNLDDEHPGEPVEVGELVDVYELANPLTVRNVDPTWTPPREGPVIDHAAMASNWAVELRESGSREVRVIECPCRAHDPIRLARVFVSPVGGVFVMVRADKPPARYRARRSTVAQAWPLHRHPNGTPHVVPTICRCRRRYIVVIDAATVRVHGVKSVNYDSVVAP